MRIFLVLAMTVIPAVAQTPSVRLLNLSRPGSRDFQIGDRFEVVITGAPNQPVSVRTTMHGRTDWGPVIASTDSTGRWSTAGQFEKSDFGDWSEVWTVGAKLASPAVQFSVDAPCLPGGPGGAVSTGYNRMVFCETANGRQTFSTPSASGSFRTPDGRLVPGRAAEQTQEQYHREILEHFITSSGKEGGAAHIAFQSSRGGLGDETADLITTLVGVNALDEDQTRNVLAILRAAFEKPETIAPSAKYPSRTLLLLRHLTDSTDQESLKMQIAETIAYVQSR
jgi:hypothetical protein